MRLNSIKARPEEVDVSPVARVAADESYYETVLALAEKTAELASISAITAEPESVAKLPAEDRRRAGYELVLHVKSCSLDLTGASYELFRLVEGELQTAMKAKQASLLTEIESIVKKLVAAEK